MLIKYTIHKIGTPKLALPNHSSFWESRYWKIDSGWMHKMYSTVFDNKDYDLPEDGEWVEIFVNEE